MIIGRGDISLAAARLREGGLVAFPTETVYGLGADALNPKAVAGVFALKGRPSNNPLIVHVGGIEDARRLSADWTSEADALARAFWPGPLTIVVESAAHVPGLVRAGGGTVALRCPAHAVAAELLRAFGGPLVGPSANRSGFVSPTRAEHVEREFAGENLLILDGGPCEKGIESTVVLATRDGPAVLRRGVVGAKALARVLGRDVPVRTAGDAGAPLQSPGQLDSHYAPRTPAVLLPLPGAARDAALAALPRPYVSITFAGGPRAAGAGTVIELAAEGALYARDLYGALRLADEHGARVIAVERPPESDDTWLAVHDRLSRATRPG